MKTSVEHGIHVPEPLHGLINDHFLEAHQQLSDMTKAQVEAEIPEMQTDYEAGIRLVDITPSGDYDPKKAFIIPYQFATPHNASQQLRLRLLAEYNGTRVLGYPNNARGHHAAYGFSEEERSQVATGDLKPLASRIGRSAANLGIERAVIAGYSQAAGVSMELEAMAEAEGMFDVMSAFHGEPANIVNRSEEQLASDIRRDGLSGLVRAIHDAGLPLLDQIQGVDKHLHIMRFAGNLSSFGANALLPDNKALKAGLSRDGFSKIADASQMDHPSVIMRAARSLVTPKAAFEAQREQWEDNGFTTVEVAKYGHAAAHNIAAYVLMASDLARQPAPVTVPVERQRAPVFMPQPEMALAA